MDVHMKNCLSRRPAKVGIEVTGRLGYLSGTLHDPARNVRIFTGILNMNLRDNQKVSWSLRANGVDSKSIRPLMFDLGGSGTRDYFTEITASHSWHG
jgi:hypothetical protein